MIQGLPTWSAEASKKLLPSIMQACEKKLALLWKLFSHTSVSELNPDEIMLVCDKSVALSASTSELSDMTTDTLLVSFQKAN